MKPIKPMLAKKVELDKIKLPCYVQPKIDGIRCIVGGDHIQTRSGKQIPNEYIKRKLYLELGSKFADVIFDGELDCGINYNDTQSKVMSMEGEPEFKYIIFDIVSTLPQFKRLDYLFRIKNKLPEWCILCKTDAVKQPSVLQQLTEEYCKDYEGIIIRDLNESYKYGRTSVLQKYKPFVDDEAILIGIEREQCNVNLPYIDELGYLKRSKSQDGMLPIDRVGKLIVKHKHYGELSIGSGLTHEQRQDIYDNYEKYQGRLVKFKYFQFGMKDKPRCPIFLGFRDERDM